MKYWVTDSLFRDSLDGLSSDEELPSVKTNPSKQSSKTNLDPDDNPGDADAAGDGSAYTEDIFIAYDEEDQEKEKETSECVQVLQKSRFNSPTIEERTRTRDLLNNAIVRVSSPHIVLLS